MRKLNLGDVFKCARMIKRLEIKEEVKHLLTKISKKSEEEDKDATAVGVEFVFDLLEIFTTEEAEKELYAFISGPLDVSEQEVRAYDLDKFATAILDIASVESWKIFFSRASQSTQ